MFPVVKLKILQTLVLSSISLRTWSFSSWRKAPDVNVIISFTCVFYLMLAELLVILCYDLLKVSPSLPLSLLLTPVLVPPLSCFWSTSCLWQSWALLRKVGPRAQVVSPHHSAALLSDGLLLSSSFHPHLRLSASLLPPHVPVRMDYRTLSRENTTPHQSFSVLAKHKVERCESELENVQMPPKKLTAAWALTMKLKMKMKLCISEMSHFHLMMNTKRKEILLLLLLLGWKCQSLSSICTGCKISTESSFTEVLWCVIV